MSSAVHSLFLSGFGTTDPGGEFYSINVLYWTVCSVDTPMVLCQNANLSFWWCFRVFSLCNIRV